MAIVSFTSYSSTDTNAGERTVTYVLNGHGNPRKDNPYSFTTKYIVDGHGGKLYANGYHVVTDAELCAIQMRYYKEQYRQIHPVTRGTGSNKHDVDVYQIYISFTEHEKFSQEEMLQIANEFIKKVHLDNFPVLVSPHYNTENDHVHAVVGAYSIDGMRKLSMNKEKLYYFRRNMDYICVEHGLSIVEPELPMLRDPEYAEFYHNVIENDIVPVIPREKKKSPCQSRRKRSMQAAMNKKSIEEQIREEKKRTEEVRRKSSKYYYSYAGAYLPYSKRPVRIYKYDEDGRERTVPELMLILLATVAVSYMDIETQYSPRNKYEEAAQTIYLGEIDTVAQRSMDAIALSRKYDVTSEEEIATIKYSIGQQMNHCKAVTKHQQLQLEENLSQIELLEADSQEYADLVFANEVIENRLAFQENKMKELKKEYRDMSWMEKTLQKKQFENELQNIRYLEKMREERNTIVSKTIQTTERHDIQKENNKGKKEHQL